jgi:hypothetical protein
MALNIPQEWAVIGIIVSALVFLAPTIRIRWHKFKRPVLPALSKETIPSCLMYPLSRYSLSASFGTSLPPPFTIFGMPSWLSR